MTIPPVGPPPGPSTPPDDRTNNNGSKVVRPASDEPRPDRPHEAAAKVELSPEARHIRDRQAEISRLHVAERAAEAVVRDAREIRRMFQELREVRNAGDERRGEQIRQRIEERAREVQGRRDSARFDEENLFDGREMRFRIGDREETIRMPDASREVERFTREVRNAVREKREPSEENLAGSMGRFIDEVRRVRTRLEEDVRESIAGAVRESSGTRPRDAAEAERLIQRARSQRAEGTNQRPSGVEQITHRAVNLLR